MINTLSKINLSKINLSKIVWEGGRSTSIWIMSLNIQVFFRVPLRKRILYYTVKQSKVALFSFNPLN